MHIPLLKSRLAHTTLEYIRFYFVQIRLRDVNIAEAAAGDTIEVKILRGVSHLIVACKENFCECCVLSGRGLCDGLVPRPEESYRVWCV
jgi:hypothetical protein